MTRFIKVNEDYVNIEDIRKIEYVGDDIYLGLFTRDKDGNILGDYELFTFAVIHTLAGEEIDLNIHLYPPEDGESEDDWANRNRFYINQSMNALENSLGEVTQITGFEYKL